MRPPLGLGVLAVTVMLGGFVQSSNAETDSWIQFDSVPKETAVYLETGLKPKYLGPSGHRLTLSAKDAKRERLNFRLLSERSGHQELSLLYFSNDLNQVHSVTVPTTTWVAYSIDLLEAHPATFGLFGLTGLAGLLGLASWIRIQRRRKAYLAREGQLDIEDNDVRLGSVVAGFRLTRRLGKGGMGAVYLGIPNADLDVSKQAAIKLITRVSSDAPALERFRRECSLSAKLSHPNIIRVLDFGDDNGIPYLVMEALEGQDLESRLGECMSGDQLWPIFRSVFAAVEYAHGQGIAHRDLKPENIFLTNSGGVKLLDFGLAVTSQLGTQAVGGTPGYLAPEALKRVQGDSAIVSDDSETNMRAAKWHDQFALGVTIYRALSGEFPAPGSGFEQTRAYLLGEFRPLSALHPEVSAELNAAIMKMIAFNPQERYSSLSEAREALETLQQGLPSALKGSRSASRIGSDG